MYRLSLLEFSIPFRSKFFVGVDNPSGERVIESRQEVNNNETKHDGRGCK